MGKFGQCDKSLKYICPSSFIPKNGSWRNSHISLCKGIMICTWASFRIVKLKIKTLVKLCTPIVWNTIQPLKMKRRMVTPCEMLTLRGWAEKWRQNIWCMWPYPFACACACAYSVMQVSTHIRGRETHVIYTKILSGVSSLCFLVFFKFSTAPMYDIIKRSIRKTTTVFSSYYITHFHFSLLPCSCIKT